MTDFQYDPEVESSLVKSVSSSGRTQTTVSKEKIAVTCPVSYGTKDDVMPNISVLPKYQDQIIEEFGALHEVLDLKFNFVKSSVE